MHCSTLACGGLRVGGVLLIVGTNRRTLAATRGTFSAEQVRVDHPRAPGWRQISYHARTMPLRQPSLLCSPECCLCGIFRTSHSQRSPAPCSRSPLRKVVQIPEIPSSTLQQPSLRRAADQRTRSRRDCGKHQASDLDPRRCQAGIPAAQSDTYCFLRSHVQNRLCDHAAVRPCGEEAYAHRRKNRLPSAMTSF